MKNFIEAAQYAFAAFGGALGAVMGGFDGFLYMQWNCLHISVSSSVWTHLRMAW